MNRREFLSNIASSLCDDPSTRNNQICNDPALKAALDEGNEGAFRFFLDEQAAINELNNVNQSSEGAGCLAVPAALVLAGFTFIHERRKKLALKSDIDYSQE